MSGLGFPLGIALCAVFGALVDYRRGTFRRDLDSMRRAQAQRAALRRIR